MALALAVTAGKVQSAGQTTGEKIQELLSDILAGLPSGSVSLERAPGENSVVLRAVPSRAGAAPISIVVPKDESHGVVLIAGRGSFFEVPPRGRRYTNLPLGDEIRAICLATIAGRLEEWVVFAGAEVVRGKGVIEIPPTITVRWGQITSLFRRDKHKVHYQYQPWVVNQPGS